METDQNLRVEKKSHVLATERRQKIFRQWSIEIVGYERHEAFYAMLAFERVDGAQAHANIFAMRDEIQQALAIARDNDHLTLLNASSEFR